TSTATRTATLDVDAGENITCTFVNTKDATVTIVKDAIPDDAADFAYTGSFGPFSLDDDANATLPNTTTFTVPAADLGSKTVTETAQAGWSLTGLSCTGDDNSSTSTATRTATLDVDAGENITCTFVNTKDATVTIVKDALPDDTQVFGYTTTGLFVTQFDLVDDGVAGAPLNTQVITVSGNDFGTKTVTEGAATGWTLSAIVCTGDDNSSTSTATRTATLDVEPGESIECTFTNVKDAKVKIVKDAVPNDAQDFSFTSQGAGLSDFSLDDDGGADPALVNQKEFTISYPDFGPKSVTEGAVFGWDLTAVVCTDTQGTGSTGDVPNRRALLNVDPGDSITCTFTNSQRASLIIRKEAKDASTAVTGLEPLGGVEFTISPNPRTGAPGSSLVVTDKELGEASEDVFNNNRGLICVDDVDPTIASFSVDETGAPEGYKQAATQPAVTSTIGSCAGRTTAAAPDATFVNIPLSTFEVLFTSQADGANNTGATAADIECVDADGNPITPDSPPAANDVHETYSDREPNEVGETYTCTIYVDP
ncbi:MAG TPA: hypothetical protein VE526_13110, partial [Solirubrobacteraceae bacterium]|nr:hypothetical protein [Solirubrobacteraceae bacterium]